MKSLILTTLQYTLPPLNIAFTIWMILMNHAFVHPTSPTSYPLRSHGLQYYSLLTLALCVTAAVLSLANLYTLYYTLRNYHPKPPWNRVYIPLITLAIVLLGSYALISSLAFRDVFAKRAYEGACRGYALMAEIEVVKGFGWDGGNSSVLGASSRVSFYKDGKRVYGLDVVRDYRMTLGFSQYRVGGDEGVPKWGVLDMRLSGRGNGTGEGVVLDLRNESYKATFRNATIANATVANTTVTNVRFANATATNATLYPTRISGFFNADAHNLSFPGLRLEQDSEWRYTDHVCLPPRVEMEDVWGEMSLDCGLYRVCALRYKDDIDVGWWDWVESVWPVVTGVIAWEVERYNDCCVKRE